MGLFKTAAKVAVASHVHGKVRRRQSQRWAAEDAATAAAQAGAPLGSSHTAPAPSSSPADDVLTRLAQLGELRAAGVLTDAEFEAQKAKMLAE